MRIGKILIEYESFYLAEISKECPEVRIEVYQTELNERSYDALITVYADAKTYPILAPSAKNAIQKSKSIVCFQLLGETADKAFYEVTVNDCSEHPTRNLQNLDGAYFPLEIIPLEAKQGKLCIYGAFEDKEAFNRCIDTLNREKDINVHVNQCKTWKIDFFNELDSFPTVFNALGIDSQGTQMLLGALIGKTSSAFYLGLDTNLLDIFFTSELLKNTRFLDVLPSIGETHVVDILKDIFWGKSRSPGDLVLWHEYRSRKGLLA